VSGVPTVASWADGGPVLSTKKPYTPKEAPKPPPAKATAVCGAPTAKGLHCKNPPGWKTDHRGTGHCTHHDGGPSGQGKHAVTIGEGMIAMHRQVMGVPVRIKPRHALMRCVEIAAGELEYIQKRMEDTIGVGEEMQLTMFGEVLKPWIRERRNAVDRLAALSSMALKANVDEREVSAKENIAKTLAVFAEGIMAGLQLTAEQRAAAPRVVREQLLLMAGERLPEAPLATRA
jgi:hypothetical protein